VIEQALTVLRAHDTVRCLFTTPKLLEALCEKISLKRAGITGRLLRRHRDDAAVPPLRDRGAPGGRVLRADVREHAHGPRHPQAPQDGDSYDIIYYPPSPRAMIEVVDPDDPERVVGYGETGRVRLTTLTRDFFMPRFLERDQAEREPPCDLYPWDGVRNVRRSPSCRRRWSKGSTEVRHIPLLRRGRPTARSTSCGCRTTARVRPSPR
jgi:hypothetical protein